MLRLLPLFFAFGPGVSLAQAPQLPQLPPGLTLQGLQGMQGLQGIPGLQGLNLGAQPGGTARYVQSEVASQRFLEGSTAGPLFPVGSAVVVLTEQGDRARVMKGDQFGWIPLASLGDTPPATPIVPE